jgi:Carboxypeptidase regulatory-like domain
MKVAALCGILTALASAQDTVTVQGVVVNHVTGAGIPQARVRLAGSASRYEAVTNETGAFQISGVKPGEYHPVVDKAGYFPLDSGPFIGSRNRIGGTDPARLRLELNPPAALRGRVVDDQGNPARASVDLSNGTLASAGADGSFVFENLAPGAYTLLARPKATQHPTATDGTRTEKVPTFYPSALDRGQAEAIGLRPGVELSGFEIRLRSVPVFRVKGIVLNPDGEPAAKAVVEARASGSEQPAFLSLGGIVPRGSFSIRTGSSGPAFAEEPVVTKQDGSFEFSSMRAGSWRIQVEGDRYFDPVRQREFAGLGAAEVVVATEDVDELKIQLTEPFDLSGTAVLSDGSAPPAGFLMGISVIGQDGFRSSGGSTQQGVLRLSGIMPGTHLIQPNVMSGSYYASSVSLGSADITGKWTLLTPASPPLKIILRPGGILEGSVEDDKAGTIVLIPQNLTGTAYHMQANSGKPFRMDGLPPGDYLAIALDRFDPRTMADQTFLRGLVPQATRVRIGEGSTASLQLTLRSVQE